MAGIYIHIPFCRKKCTYCDFHFSTTFQGYRGEMLLKMIEELENRAQEIQDPIESVYFGGGTPSLLTPDEIGNFLLVIRSQFSLSTDAEITLEVNPEDLTMKNLDAWWRLGFNRLSIGVQSLDDKLLTWMNRNHNAEQVTKGLELLLQSPFKNHSVDVIYGVPGQDNDALRDTLTFIKRFKVPHVSAYSLTMENKTLLNHMVKTFQLAPINEDHQIEQYQIVKETLEDLGYEQYEISNYAQPGAQAIHNTNYWKNKPYVGIGPGAHSFDGIKQRRWNVSNNAQYLKQEAWFEAEVLDTNNQWNEVWLTGLRTKWGVSHAAILALGGFVQEEESLVQSLVLEGKMSVDETCITLTEQGKLSADGICALLFRVA